MKVCKFCGGQSENFPRSHVIPEFFMKGAFEPKEKYRAMYVKRGINPGDINEMLQQKRILGEDVDNNLLCFKCESLFQRWEGPASKILIGNNGYKSKIIHNPSSAAGNPDNFEIATDINYKTIKMFLLSILWRSSVSEISITETITLGPHENKIKKLLFDNDPGSDLTYVIAIFKVFLENKPFLYTGTHHSKMINHHCIHIYGQGYRFTVFISSHNIPDYFLRLRLQENGQAKIPFLGANNLPEIKFLFEKG